MSDRIPKLLPSPIQNWQFISSFLLHFSTLSINSGYNSKLMPNLLLHSLPNYPPNSLLPASEHHLKPWSWHAISSLAGSAYLQGGYSGSLNRWLLSKHTTPFLANQFDSFVTCSSLIPVFWLLLLLYFILIFCSIFIYIYKYCILLFATLDAFLFPC